MTSGVYQGSRLLYLHLLQRERGLRQCRIASLSRHRLPRPPSLLQSLWCLAPPGILVAFPKPQTGWTIQLGILPNLFSLLSRRNVKFRNTTDDSPSIWNHPGPTFVHLITPPVEPLRALSATTELDLTTVVSTIFLQYKTSMGSLERLLHPHPKLSLSPHFSLRVKKPVPLSFVPKPYPFWGHVQPCLPSILK